MSGSGHRLMTEQAGMTLIELLIAMVMTVVVFGTTLDVIFVGFRDQTASGNRAAATQLSSAIVERMTREIRQASQATIENGTGALASPGGRLDLETPVFTAGGSTTTQHVLYDCTSANRCTRDQGPANGPLSGSPTLVIAQVTNPTTVFSGSTASNPTVASNPTAIALTLDVDLATQGITHPVELRDGVALRDLTP